MDNSTHQVLVVGAGPTGLAMAAALSRLGIKVRVIDRNPARSDKSKALGVQAGTLECLARGLDPGVSRRMIDKGHPTYEAFIHIDDRKPIPVDLRSIPGPNNFILILAQSETEQILEEYLEGLGVRVERNTELLGFEDRGNSVSCSLRTSAGKEEVFSASYVVGCDGAHSTVRHELKVPFDGGAYEGEFILGDVALQWPWSYDSVRTFVSGRGVIAAFPMRGERKYRLILIPRKQGKGTKESSGSGPEINEEEFRSLLGRLENSIRIDSTSWLTRFRVHHRMVSQMRKGRVFLAGDAAHIHSPAGGQGMNTGIQDALNLSFKLARVFAGEPETLLDAYARERLPVAKGVLRGTDWVFRLALLPERPPVRMARRFLLPKIVGSKWVQRIMTRAISEMSIAHQEVARYSTTSYD